MSTLFSFFFTHTSVGPTQRAMLIKGYSEFPKAPALLEPHHQII